jgi:hypothetical protein
VRVLLRTREEEVVDGVVRELTEKKKRRGTGREALLAALGRKRRGEARVSLGFDRG